MNALLADYPAASLTPEGLRRAGNGNPLGPDVVRVEDATANQVRAGDRMRILDGSGEVLSVAEWRSDGLLHPLLVLR
jgi:hypothetical protein